jgi:hypothetical protein
MINDSDLGPMPSDSEPRARQRTREYLLLGDPPPTVSFRLAAFVIIAFVVDVDRFFFIRCLPPNLAAVNDADRCWWAC